MSEGMRGSRCSQVCSTSCSATKAMTPIKEKDSRTEEYPESHSMRHSLLEVRM